MSPSSSRRRAVFLDRDNTLIFDPGFIDDPAMVRLLPGVPEGLARLAALGYRLIVVTNQSGVARGLLTEQRLQEIHEELRRQLRASGVDLTAIYYCPYLADGSVPAYSIESQDRKPAPGMLRRAAAEHDIDLAQSWMIGDRARDVEAGRRAGCRTVRIAAPAGGTGILPVESPAPDFFAAHFAEAAALIESNSAFDKTPAAPQ